MFEILSWFKYPQIFNLATKASRQIFVTKMTDFSVEPMKCFTNYLLYLEKL